MRRVKAVSGLPTLYKEVVAQIKLFGCSMLVFAVVCLKNSALKRVSKTEIENHGLSDFFLSTLFLKGKNCVRRDLLLLFDTRYGNSGDENTDPKISN